MTVENSFKPEKFDRKIILGSKSPSRNDLLRSLGYEFQAMSPDIDEKAIRFEDPKALTLALANAKADALLPKISESALLITSDQVIVWNGKIREKPVSADEARAFLRSYAQHPAEAVTSVVVADTASQKRVGEVDVAKVWFREIPEEVIEQLIEQGKVFKCAGGFSVEDPLLTPYIERIEGTTDSIMGLPKQLTEDLIQRVQH